MASTVIALGETESIKVYVVDAYGDPLLGKTDLFVKLQRSSDRWFLDWSDMTFKSSGHVSLTTNLDEVGDGIYELSGGFDSGAVVNLDPTEDLNVIPLQDPGDDAILPAPVEIKIRPSAVLDIREELSRILGLLHENAFIDNTVFDDCAQLTGSRIRIFNSASAVQAATEGGTETNGLIATYQVVVEYDTPGKMKSYRVVRL